MPASPVVGMLSVAALAHGIWRWRDLIGMGRRPQSSGRIDRQMRGALTFVMGFVMVPLIAL